jgi:hypothetical protein
MDRKHLGLGLLIGFGFVTYFLLEVHKVSLKQDSLKKNFVGVINGESIYRNELEESFSTTIKNQMELEKYFHLFVDKKLIALEAQKLNITSEEYLNFFNSLSQLPPTNEELKYFSEWTEDKIQNTRIERAKESLLKILRRQNKIQFHSNNSQ